VLVRLDGGGSGEDEEGPPESAVLHCAAVLRREANGAGPVLRHGANEFLLMLNADPDGARALLERVRAQTRGPVKLRAGIAAHDPAAGSAHDLLRHARAALEHDG
jgi:GGDEF domain-containing protein